jgi:mono/diheme cytochrome c family protein
VRSPVPYLDDASFRRAEMLASLANPADGYAMVREEHYSTGRAGDWDHLREWNPPTETVAASELDAPGGASTSALSPRAEPLAIALSPSSEDDAALVELGSVAFRRYPVQLAPYLRVALVSRDAPGKYGLWIDGARGVGGLVRARMADGSGAIALTCSTCHSSAAGNGGLSDGVSNAALNVGAAMVDAARGPLDPAAATTFAAWGAGRVDVSSHTGKEPARIADVRPVAWLGYLQQDATVKQNNLTSLAVRIETLITTSQNEAVRPPRIVALALAAYVRSLGKALPVESEAAAKSPAGKAVFESHCTRCHATSALTGSPVSLRVIGTDPTLGLSADRGTGNYRVPTLHGVGTRGPLLHDGTVPSLDAMFDPRRVEPGYSGRLHGSGPIAGHRFGLDLDASSRAALVKYLRAL